MSFPLSGNTRFLVAESNGRMLSIIVDMLQHLGCNAVGVRTVADVVAKLRSCPTDVLLIYVHLMDGSGVEAAKRAVASFPELKVIFLTDFKHQIPSALGFRFVELQKPFYISDLRDAVLYVLDLDRN